MTGVGNTDQHTYTPTGSGELAHVTGAMNLWRQVVEAERAKQAGNPWPSDVDARYIAGYVDACAFAQAVVDGWCEDAADTTLWRECARLHGAGPGVDGAYRYARTDAWREYIRRAGADLARTFPQAVQS